MLGYLRSMVLAAVLFAVVAGSLGGCNRSDPRVRDSLKEANEHLKKSGEYIKELEGFKKQWEILLAGQSTTDAMPRLKELLSSARGSEQGALQEVKEAARELESTRELKVSGEMRTYLDMELDALNEQEAALSTEVEAMDLRLQNADALGAGASLDSSTIMREKKIIELQEKSREQGLNAAELSKKANEYYESKKLGK